jgi:hypothetical protein
MRDKLFSIIARIDRCTIVLRVRNGGIPRIRDLKQQTLSGCQRRSASHSMDLAHALFFSSAMHRVRLDLAEAAHFARVSIRL